jgi:hypothetical protein
VSCGALVCCVRVCVHVCVLSPLAILEYTYSCTRVPAILLRTPCFSVHSSSNLSPHPPSSFPTFSLPPTDPSSSPRPTSHAPPPPPTHTQPNTHTHNTPPSVIHPLVSRPRPPPLLRPGTSVPPPWLSCSCRCHWEL